MIFISGKTHPDTPLKDGLKKGDTGIHALINLSIQFRPSYYIDDIQILSYKVYLSIQYSKITSFLGLLMFIASKLRQILAGAALARLRTGSELAVKFAVFWAVFMGSCGKNRRFWHLFCQQKMVVLLSKLSKIPSENGELTGPPPATYQIEDSHPASNAPMCILMFTHIILLYHIVSYCIILYQSNYFSSTMLLWLQ